MAEIENKKEYEISYLLKDEAGAEILRKSIEHAGGSIKYMDEVRRINLAYPIQKETAAYFGWMQVDLDPASIADLSNELHLEQEVLRFLIIEEPIKVVRKEHEERDKDPDKPKAERPQKEERAATNEELEKRLQEILG